MKHFFLMSSLSVLVLFKISSCSTTSHLNEEIRRPGHFRLYSYPDPPSLETPPGHRRIVIGAINDFHGQLEPRFEAVEGRASSYSIPVGGAEYLSAYIKVLRQKYPQELLLLDAGDIFQGSLISNRFKGKSVADFYRHLQFDASTLGNHEFDFGPTHPHRFMAHSQEDPQGMIKRLIRMSKIPFVVSNILEIKSGTPLAWPGVQQTLLKEVNGIKVGLVGTTTLETLVKALPGHLRGLYLQEMPAAITRWSQELRKEGAQVVILLTHAGLSCGKAFAQKHQVPLAKVNFDPQDPHICDLNGELPQVLKELASGTIDAVVAGHTHQKVANIIHGIPVIQSFAFGQYLGRMELFVDQKTGLINPRHTVIHQPVKICHHFFKASEDCYSQDSSMDYSQLIPARFLGELITPDKSVPPILANYRRQVQKKSAETLIKLPFQMPFERHQESPWGRLVVDAMAHALGEKLAMVNAGAIRQGVSSGPLSYGELYQILPYQNYLTKVQLSGEQLRQIVQIACSGNLHGTGLFAGLQIQVAPQVPSSSDRDGDGQIERWEQWPEVTIKLDDGSLLQDERSYTLVTNDYLGVMGGDHYGHVFQQIPAQRKKIYSELTYRDAVARFLRRGPSAQRLSDYLDASSRRIHHVQKSP